MGVRCGCARWGLQTRGWEQEAHVPTAPEAPRKDPHRPGWHLLVAAAVPAVSWLVGASLGLPSVCVRILLPSQGTRCRLRDPPYSHDLVVSQWRLPSPCFRMRPLPGKVGYGLNASFQGMRFYPQWREKLILLLVTERAYTWSLLALEDASKSVTKLVLLIYLVVPVITPGPLQVFLVVLWVWPLLGPCVAGFLGTRSSSPSSPRTHFFHLPGVCCVDKAQG